MADGASPERRPDRKSNRLSGDRAVTRLAQYIRASLHQQEQPVSERARIRTSLGACDLESGEELACTRAPRDEGIFATYGAGDLPGSLGCIRCSRGQDDTVTAPIEFNSLENT